MDNNPFGYQSSPPPEQQTPPPPPQNRQNAYAVASLALGIASICIGFLCCCLPVFLVFAGICGILAIVFAVLSRRDTPDGRLPNMAVAGLVLGILGIVLCILILFFVFFVDVEEFYRRIGLELDTENYRYPYE